MPANSLDYRTPPHDPALLYAALYAGEIVRYSGLPEMAAVVTGTRRFVEERLAHSPVEIHRHVEHEELALQLAAVQRDYARSSEVKKLWQALFEAAGLDPEDTARDRLVLRFQVHSDADVRAGRGAPNVDSRGRWAAPGMFHRLSDGRALNELLGCEPLIPYAGGTGVDCGPRDFMRKLTSGQQPGEEDLG